MGKGGHLSTGLFHQGLQLDMEQAEAAMQPDREH